jgi:focal adhesion kinase 1
LHYFFLFQISKEIPRENIECSGGPLGEGQFGEVFKGRYTRADGKVVDAAIKMCKATAGNKELVEFLREAAIMGQFDHPHIIAIFG